MNQLFQGGQLKSEIRNFRRSSGLKHYDRGVYTHSDSDTVTFDVVKPIICTGAAELRLGSTTIQITIVSNQNSHFTALVNPAAVDPGEPDLS